MERWTLRHHYCDLLTNQKEGTAGVEGDRARRHLGSFDLPPVPNVAEAADRQPVWNKPIAHSLTACMLGGHY